MSSIRRVVNLLFCLLVGTPEHQSVVGPTPSHVECLFRPLRSVSSDVSSSGQDLSCPPKDFDPDPYRFIQTSPTRPSS